MTSTFPGTVSGSGGSLRSIQPTGRAEPSGCSSRDEIDRIAEINALTGMVERYVDHVSIYPASHYVASREKLSRAMQDIQRECDEQVAWFRSQNKLLASPAHRPAHGV